MNNMDCLKCSKTFKGFIGDECPYCGAGRYDVTEVINLITIKKYLGDDIYSWAVFKNGRPVITGLSKREAIYHRGILLKGDIDV